MDKADRNRTDQRGDTQNQPGNDPPTAKTGTHLPPAGTPARDIVTVCGWCQEAGRLNILKIEPCHDWEAIVIYLRGKDIRVFRNNHRLYISHGICPECRQREFPETTGRKL